MAATPWHFRIGCLRPTTVDRRQHRRKNGCPQTSAARPGSCQDVPRQPDDDALRVLDVLTPLTIRLREAAARELIDQAEREMTLRGANPRGEFTQALRDAIDHAQRQALVEQRQRAVRVTEARSQLSTESARPDAHQLT